MVKVVVTAKTNSIDGPVDEVFGRCGFFMVADVKDGGFSLLSTEENSVAKRPSGVGVAAAQRVAELGAEAVITGIPGPKAGTVLQQFGIKVYNGTGYPSVKEALEALASGKL